MYRDSYAISGLIISELSCERIFSSLPCYMKGGVHTGRLNPNSCLEYWLRDNVNLQRDANIHDYKHLSTQKGRIFAEKARNNLCIVDV